MCPLPNSSNIQSVGCYGKVNYQNLPPSDPTVDYDNTLLAPAITDIANMSMTAPRFVARLTLAATTGALVINSWEAVWQNATSTTPVFVRTGTGTFTLTLPSNVSDQYTQSIGNPSIIPVNLLSCVGSFENGTFGFCNFSCSTNVITINTANSGGSASDLAGAVINLIVR